MDKKRSNLGMNSKNPHDAIDCTPPDFILPASSDRPLVSLHPNLGRESNKLQCLKVLTTSGWNPPPG